jgi:hypothetical protein
MDLLGTCGCEAQQDKGRNRELHGGNLLNGVGDAVSKSIVLAPQADSAMGISLLNSLAA